MSYQIFSLNFSKPSLASSPSSPFSLLSVSLAADQQMLHHFTAHLIPEIGRRFYAFIIHFLLSHIPPACIMLLYVSAQGKCVRVSVCDYVTRPQLAGLSSFRRQAAAILLAGFCFLEAGSTFLPLKQQNSAVIAVYPSYTIHSFYYSETSWLAGWHRPIGLLLILMKYSLLASSRCAGFSSSS